ncbi:hypothetical protein ACLOJK_031557 [Asimina triloba]
MVVDILSTWSRQDEWGNSPWSDGRQPDVVLYVHHTRSINCSCTKDKSHDALLCASVALFCRESGIFSNFGRDRGNIQWIALCVHHTALIYLDLGRLRGLYERGERLIAKEGRKKVGEKSQKRSRMLFTVVFVGFCSMLAYAYYVLWWKHEKMRESLRRQGIKGPHHSFLYGSIPEMKKIVALEKENRSTTTTVRHNYSSILFPYFDRWREQYGKFQNPNATGSSQSPEHPFCLLFFYRGFCFSLAPHLLKIRTVHLKEMSHPR